MKKVTYYVYSFGLVFRNIITVLLPTDVDAEDYHQASSEYKTGDKIEIQ